MWSAEGATIEAPYAPRRVGWGLGRGFSLPSGIEVSGERLCLSPENFSNFCLEIACYSALWKQFFRLDSSLFTDEIVTLTQRHALDPHI